MSEGLLKKVDVYKTPVKVNTIAIIADTVSYFNANPQPLIDAIKSWPETINFFNRYGESALHVAVHRGNHSAFVLLTTCDNVNINIKNSHGKTPLMCLIDYSPVKSSILRYCLGRNDLDLDLELKDPKGRTVLMKTYQKALKISVGLILNTGINNCLGWQEWPTNYRGALVFHATQLCHSMERWRSFKPDWCVAVHKKYYPSEFDSIVRCVLKVFKRICLKHDIKFYKDIRLMLIRHIADSWRKTRDYYRKKDKPDYDNYYF